MAWGVGGTSHCYTPEVLSHMVCLGFQLPSDSLQSPELATDTPQHKVQWASNASLNAGTPIHVIGSPFGALSPGHFANSFIQGVVSNQWPASASSNASEPLLTADIRSMPGMEGSPAFNSQGQLVAILLPPLLSTDFKTEVRHKRSQKQVAL